MEASGMAAIRARGGKKDELGVQTNQLVRSVKTFDDACVFDHPSFNFPFLTCRRRFFFFVIGFCICSRRSDKFNERLPSIELGPSPTSSGTSTPSHHAFPLVQAPSTRRRPSSHDDVDLEERFPANAGP